MTTQSMNDASAHTPSSEQSAAFREELDGVRYTRRKFRQERDSLQQRLTAAEQRILALETAIAHALDDSSEDAQTGEITIMRLDYESLLELIGEDS